MQSRPDPTSAGNTPRPNQERKRPPDEALLFAISHIIRLEALAIMNLTQASPSEIAEMLDETVPVVSHHIRGLFRDGLIEFSGEVKRGRAVEHFYRAIAPPPISSEQYEAMTPAERRAIAAPLVQAIVAELLVALMHGTLQGSREPWLAWRALELDRAGETEVRELAVETEEKLIGIEKRNIDRISTARAQVSMTSRETSPTGTTHVTALLTFERGRQVDQVFEGPRQNDSSQ